MIWITRLRFRECGRPSEQRWRASNSRLRWIAACPHTRRNFRSGSRSTGPVRRTVWRMTAICALRPFTAPSSNRMTPPHRGRSRPECPEFEFGTARRLVLRRWRPQPDGVFVPIYTIRGSYGQERQGSMAMVLNHNSGGLHRSVERRDPRRIGDRLPKQRAYRRLHRVVSNRSVDLHRRFRCARPTAGGPPRAAAQRASRKRRRRSSGRRTRHANARDPARQCL